MTQNQESNSLMNNIVTSIAIVKDEDNNIKTYNSVIHDKELGKKPKPTQLNLKNDIIENFETLVFKIGMFSSRLYNYDDFDNVPYSKDDIISKKIVMSELVGYYTPYDLVIYHKDNEWKYMCLNVEFELSKNIIPIINTNFPRILEIPRSNGTVQKALIPKTGGFIIRRSTKLNDKYDKIYVRVYFDETNKSEVNDDNLYNLKSYKDIPMDILLDYNEYIKDFTINHYLFKRSDYEMDSELTSKEIKNCILEYYDNKKKIWIIDKLNPVIERLSSIIKINNIIN